MTPALTRRRRGTGRHGAGFDGDVDADRLDERLGRRDGVVADDADDAEPAVEVAKTNLTKRRIIDNFLEERRLHKQLSEYDFDI